MTCDEARAAFSDLYDGALSGAPLAALDQHLDGCPACRVEWDLFLKSIQTVAELGGAQPSPGFADRIREQIEAPSMWQRVGRALFFPVRVKVPIQALALVLVAFTAVMIFQRSSELKRQASPPASSAPSPQLAPRVAGTPPPQQTRERAQGSVPADRRKTEDQGAGESGDAKARSDALQTAKPGQREAAPAAPPALGRIARPEEEKDRGAEVAGRADMPGSQTVMPGAPSPAQDEAKELGKKAMPAEAERYAEPMPRSRGEEPESGGAGRRFREASPRALMARPAAPPAEAPPAVAAPTPPAPLKDETSRQAKEGFVASLPTGSADDLYSAGLTEFARRDYDRATEAFLAFIARYPRDARVPDARFYVADSHFAKQRYAEAIPEYEALVQQFPESRRVPAALLRQGQARLALGDQTGCKVLRDVADRYSRTREAAQARESLAASCP